MKKIYNTMAIIGLIIAFGSVGNSDYMTEIGAYEPLPSTMLKILIGLALMLPMAIAEIKEQAKND